MPPPLPPVAASLFAICCRCQLRAAPRRTRSASRLSYSPALDTPPPHPHPHPPNHGPKSGARPASRPPPSFGTSYPGDYSPAFDSPYRTQGPKTKSGRELIVIPPPGPKTPSACDLDGLLDAVGPLEAADLAELSQSILVYEQEAVLDATQMEISLLKPATTRVSKERFEQLYDQLNQAFNLPQLRNYYDKAARAEGPAVPRLKPTTKMDTIRSIMKHRWGMVIAEEIPEREDVIVTEAIESNKRDIFFLIGEDGRILRYWAHHGNARITVDVANNQLSIRGSRASIESIQGWLHTYLKDVVSEEVDLKATSRIAPFEDSVIPVVARMTNTYIERIDKDTLKIAGLGSTRDRVDDARRLLFSSVDLRLRRKESLLFNPPMDNARVGALFPFSEGSALPWTCRNRNLGRWKLVKKKPLSGVPPPPPKFSLNQFGVIRRLEGGRGSREVVLEALDGMGGTISEMQSERGLRSEYEAVLGHVLYNIHTDDYNLRADSYELSLPEFIHRSAGEPRILCNTFPGIPVFTQHPIGRPDFEIPPPPLRGASAKEFFQLRFLPSPWAQPKSFECYPPIRVVVEIDAERGTPRDPEIYALAAECNADVLLPALPCDLRFVRYDEVALQVLRQVVSKDGGVEADEWDRFMATSSLDPSQDMKLRASPNLRIYIPSWMVLPSPHKLAHNRGPAAARTGNDRAVAVVYQFTGMEYRRAVSLEDKGYVLSRTVVEGGVSGGRRTEVKLRYAPTPSPPSPSPSPSPPPDPHTHSAETAAGQAAGRAAGRAAGQEQPMGDELGVSRQEGFVRFVNKAISSITWVEAFLEQKK